MAAYLEQLLGKIEEFEGSIPWMYRDTVGKVTVGVGLMLPHAEAARRLPFAMGERAATAEEITAEFARVEALPMGRPALYYRREGGLELGKDAIDGLLRSVVEGMEAELRGRVKGFEGMPDGVKMALLDMAYNLGVDGLVKGYPKMMRAVEVGDWAQAAGASFRHGPGAARNAWTREMLAQGVVGTIQAEIAAVEGGLKRLGYGLIGMMASWLGY
jgi:GH24 family phage-related lysozyme (muramidase)